jgi:cellulose synthase (UDP-forming)
MQLPKNIAELPIVDVLIPTYNESNEIIRTTITAATQMEYPRDRLRVHICDDEGTLYKRSQPDSMAAA